MRGILILLMSLITTLGQADIFSPVELTVLKKNFLANITSDGAVAASPSKNHPNYYYDWVRDAALSMGLIVNWYEKTAQPQDKQRLFSYVTWVEKAQRKTHPLSGYDILGEPKFYMDGRPYDGDWGRPQNDGPALRALTLIHFAQLLLTHNDIDYVQSHLYGSGFDIDTMGVIKIDLEYTASHWQDKNYDLWEEVYGHHFFTAITQREALLEGAILARQLKDFSTAAYYSQQAQSITQHLNQFIDTDNQVVQATLAPHPGPQKPLELDSAILLAVLLNHHHNPAEFALDSPLIKHTAIALKKQFKARYPINKNYKDAVLFGRYDSDTYDGYQNDGLGNPWFILTATMAEYYYTLADLLPLTSTNRPFIDTYIQLGDDYLNLVKAYAPTLNLSEQINLNTGISQGAQSLTWSYVAVLHAVNVREVLIAKLGQPSLHNGLPLIK